MPPSSKSGGLPCAGCLGGCTNLTNLTPLAEMTTLQTLELSRTATDIEFLRGLTNLTCIGFKYDSTAKDPDKTAAQFWADYDKNRN